MQSAGEMQSMATNIFSAYASMTASIMLFRSIANDMIPAPVKSFLQNAFGPFIKRLLDNFFLTGKQPVVTLIVDEQNGMLRNQIYDAAETYLRTRITLDSDRLWVAKSSKQNNITFNIVKDQEVVNQFNSFDLKWQFILVEPDPPICERVKQIIYRLLRRLNERDRKPNQDIEIEELVVLCSNNGGFIRVEFHQDSFSYELGMNFRIWR